MRAQLLPYTCSYATTPPNYHDMSTFLQGLMCRKVFLASQTAFKHSTWWRLSHDRLHKSTFSLFLLFSLSLTLYWSTNLTFVAFVRSDLTTLWSWLPIKLLCVQSNHKRKTDKSINSILDCNKRYAITFQISTSLTWQTAVPALRLEKE